MVVWEKNWINKTNALRYTSWQTHEQAQSCTGGTFTNWWLFLSKATESPISLICSKNLMGFWVARIHASTFASRSQENWWVRSGSGIPSLPIPNLAAARRTSWQQVDIASTYGHHVTEDFLQLPVNHWHQLGTVDWFILRLRLRLWIELKWETWLVSKKDTVCCPHRPFSILYRTIDSHTTLDSSKQNISNHKFRIMMDKSFHAQKITPSEPNNHIIAYQIISSYLHIIWLSL